MAVYIKILWRLIVLVKKAREVDNLLNRIGRNMSRMGGRMGMLATGAGALLAGEFVRADIELENAMLQLKSNLISTYKDADELNGKLKAIRDSAKEISLN